jgi:hypothetical protein
MSKAAAARGFDMLMESLRDPSIGPTALSPIRFIAWLGIDLQTLARQANVHRNTLGSSPSSEKVLQFLREALRVIRAATDISGDVDYAIFWYRNEPLQPFDYQTAETLVSQHRTEDLLSYIMTLRAGAAGGSSPPWWKQSPTGSINPAGLSVSHQPGTPCSGLRRRGPVDSRPGAGQQLCELDSVAALPSSGGRL